ncbi:MAG: OadG family protein [Clostridia bacterium]|nr:OadG family protein [Clostridia bacterium]
MFGIEDFTKKIVDFQNFDPSQLSDALLFGGAILLIGMLTVFSVLIILWLCLTLFKLCFSKKTKSEKANSSVSEVQIQQAQSKSDDKEIVAVIAAAIAAAESETDGLKFRVVSFRRK